VGGSLTWWDEQNLMVYRYGLVLAGDQVAGPRPDRHDDRCGGQCLRTILPRDPAGDMGRKRPPKQALEIAIAGAYGRA